ncbi:MAG: hypothetical protein ACRYGM_10235 [Janthinobacterium lividum]
MARKPQGDERQTDFFGTAAPAPVASPAPPRRHPRRAAVPRPDAAAASDGPPQAPPNAPPNAPAEALPEAQPETLQAGRDDLDVQLAGLPVAGLRGLAAALPDEVLARLTLTVMRELRRRLGPGGARDGKPPATALSRAAQQLVAELAEPGEDSEF